MKSKKHNIGWEGWLVFCVLVYVSLSLVTYWARNPKLTQMEVMQDFFKAVTW